jgi:hypothetical protein
MLTLKILVYTTVIFLSIYFLDFFQVIHHEIQTVKISNNYNLNSFRALSILKILKTINNS